MSQVDLPAKWILRELAVNWLGYKLRFRSLLKNKRNNNINWNIEKDVTEKGEQRLTYIKNTLHSFLGDEAFATFWPPRRIVEIGPGGTMLLGLYLLSEGTEEYIGIDRFPSDVWGNYPNAML